MVRIARVESFGGFVPGGDDVHLGRLRDGAEDEFGVAGDRQAAAARERVADAEALDADGVGGIGLEGDEGEERLLQGVAVVLEFGVALAVPRG
jgi:hypothetical protein